ncbi:MAG TPA: cyclase family protein [Thermoanaerobaculia bacterium]|nr:cyclase family protein [Thermoanaerobaculia bacterium]
MPRLVDLSHPIEHGMITYPGLPGPVVSDFMGREASRGHYAEGTTFHIARLRMVGNTGTYLDAPFHRFAHGKDVGSLPLERLADLEGVVVDASGRGAGLDAEIFAGRDLAGKAVLVRTGWDAHWRTPRYAEGHPHLTRAAAEFLAGAGPALVGIDSLNIDDTGDGVRPAHTLLLSAGIPIVEHLCNLGGLPPSGFRLHCVPAPFLGLGSFPVRAYAVVA